MIRKQDKLIHDSFVIPIYNHTIKLIFYRDHNLVEDFFKTIDKDYDWDFSDYDAGVIDADYLYVIFEIGDSKKDFDTSVIVHECTHLKNKIFKHINHNLDIDNDEPEAYLIQYLYETINDKIKKL